MRRWVGCLLLLAILPIKAEDLIDQLSVRAGAIDFMQGKFVLQRQISALPLPLESYGTFEYSKLKGINWKTLAPVVSLINISEHGILSDDIQRHQVGTDQFAVALLGIFSGDLSGLQNQFSISAIGSLDKWQLTLEPSNPAIAARIVNIRISGAENTESIQIEEANRDNTVINLVTDHIRAKGK